MVAGALFVLMEIGFILTYTSESFLEAAENPLWQATNAVAVIAFAVAIPAVMGLYRQQAEESGPFGLVAAGALCAGLVLAAGAMWASLFVVPWLATNAPELLAEEASGGSVDLGYMLSFIALGLGLVLFGISTWLSGVYARWMAVAIIVGGIAGSMPFVPFGPGFVAGAAFVGYGLSLRHKVHALEASEAHVMPPGAPA